MWKGRRKIGRRIDLSPLAKGKEPVAVDRQNASGYEPRILDPSPNLQGYLHLSKEFEIRGLALAGRREDHFSKSGVLAAANRFMLRQLLFELYSTVSAPPGDLSLCHFALSSSLIGSQARTEQDQHRAVGSSRSGGTIYLALLYLSC